MEKLARVLFVVLLSVYLGKASAQFATSEFGGGEIITGTPGSSLFNINSYSSVGGADLSSLSTDLGADCSATTIPSAVIFMDGNADGTLTCQEVNDTLSSTDGVTFNDASPQQATFIINHLDGCSVVDAACLSGAVAAADNFLLTALNCGDPAAVSDLTGLGTGVDDGTPISISSYPSLDIFDTNFDGEIYDTEVVNLFGAWQEVQPSSDNVPAVQKPTGNPGLYADAYLTACSEMASDETLADVITAGNASDPLGTALFAAKKQKAIAGTLVLADLNEISLNTGVLGTPTEGQMDYLVSLLDTSETASKDDWQGTIDAYDADAPANIAQTSCYEGWLERKQAISLGYDGNLCADGKLYARALGRRQVNHPSEVLLQIAFASGATNTEVQIASNQYEADCDDYIATTDGVTGDGCADLTRDQFLTIRTNHDAAQNDGYGSSEDRTAALAATPAFTTGCSGANDYYVSVGSLSNPTLNPACALTPPFTGIAGPDCWESITDITYWQHQNYEKDDFACVLRNTGTTSARFGDTTLASLTDGEFLYLKDCFFDLGNNRTVQGLRDCATSATEWDQAVFPIREFSNANFGGGSTTASCNLTLDQIEALGAFDDLNEGTYLNETKTLFDGNHCRRVNAAGEEVNCKEIVCDALRNPPTGLNSMLSNREWMRQTMCYNVNRAFKQKGYHHKIKKHYFVEACQAPIVGTSDDFEILNWPMVKNYRVHYGIAYGRAPNQNQNYSGIAYDFDPGPESWETERSLTQGRFEYSAVPDGYYGGSQFDIPVGSGTKNLRVYSFGNVSRHRQTGWTFDVEFKSNICIQSGKYNDHNSYPNTGLYSAGQNFYWIPFPVSILPNEVDAARNTRQRGAIDTSDSTMNVSLVGSSAGAVAVGNMQAASTGQTAFERNHFKGTDIGAVKITSLPALGSLTYRASAVTANQILPSGDLSELKFEPPTGAPAISNNYTSFTFRNYAPWSSVETAVGLTSFACHEVPDFETESPAVPTWAWPDKSETSGLRAHNTGGHGNWPNANCSGQSKASTRPGAPDWTTPSDYQKVLRFINIPTPSDPNSYTPSSAATTGLACDE